MNRAEALYILRIFDELQPSPERVREAFRQAAKEVHPDSTYVGSHDTARTMEQLVRAREYLLCNKDSTCQLCGGSGKVQGRMGLRSCSCTKDRR